ncbi:energy transducer TonB [Carboxylicivirga marina]|uniref:energy transducer TonB n=1 Tax=Carboxylicivirga marina TaxID=2800988 RepID=UPI002599B7BF|nr:energy transducer TonB [uncultured Carboxylicivirga sp.]
MKFFYTTLIISFIGLLPLPAQNIDSLFITSEGRISTDSVYKYKRLIKEIEGFGYSVKDFDTKGKLYLRCYFMAHKRYKYDILDFVNLKKSHPKKTIKLNAAITTYPNDTTSKKSFYDDGVLIKEKVVYSTYYASGILKTKRVYENGIKVEDNIFPEDLESGPTFFIVDKMPEYPGGEEGFVSDIQAALVYPKEAIKKKIQGIVYVEFVVNTKGELVEPKIKQSVHPLIDNEALRIVKTTKKWIPGKSYGRLAKVRYSVPVVFKLPSSH